MEQKPSTMLIAFAVLCMIALVLIAGSALRTESNPSAGGQPPTAIEPVAEGFGANGASIYQSLDRMSEEYLKGGSSDRTLQEYYSRRQYAGSPPYIPHVVDLEHDEKLPCLTCHKSGGWRADLKRNTPLTPHPEYTVCVQCHVTVDEGASAPAIAWFSAPPPRLGISILPGSPPPFPHDLQMRGNCIACHVGPGAVTEIRIDHIARGNCRQCHMPEASGEHFERTS